MLWALAWQLRAISAIRAAAADALAAAPDYPDVVGPIRMLRFLRGFNVRVTVRRTRGVQVHVSPVFVAR